MRKNNIVFIRSNPINPDSRVEKEMDTLLYNDYNVFAIAWDRSKDYREKKESLELASGEVPIYRIGIKASFGEGFKNLLPFIKFQLYILKWLIKNKEVYDVIHACDFDTAFVSNLSTMFTKKRIIFDIFDYLSTDATNILKKTIKRMENHIINSADATIICTEKRKNQIAGTHPRKLAIIHNTPKKIISNFKNPETKTKLVYVGILQDFRLLKEMLEVISKRSDCELHIGGFGKYEKFFLEASKTYDNIFFYGKLSYNETLKLEKKCDIITAIYDPKIGNHIYAAPNKFYEALMLGKPLIMVKNTGMSEIVSDNEIGVCIDYTAESLNEGINILISKKSQWQEISNKMIKIYDKEYSWDVMEVKLLELYCDICGG